MGCGSRLRFFAAYYSNSANVAWVASAIECLS